MSSARPPQPRAKPVRYWPGKAPKGAAEAAGGSSDSDEDEDDVGDKLQSGDKEIQEVSSASTTLEVPSGGDRRLMRLQESRRGVEVDGEEGGRRARVEGRSQASVARAEASARAEESEDESDEAVAARRAKARAKALATRKEEEDRLAAQEQAEVQEEESEYTSEYTSDSEDDLVSSRTMLKPVFVTKNKRETILERERQEALAEAAELERIAQQEAKKLESHHMVAEELLREQAAAEAITAAPDVDDTDNLDEEQEYAAWKLRELQRIKRDRSEADAREAARDDIERRRGMTDAEIMEEKRRDGTFNTSTDGGGADKQKHRFMQKYFHKGAFFVDDERVGKALENRDFAQPTLDDNFDKSALPGVMQVKNFGRSGQTKWTHLGDQDTSNMDSPWFQKSDVNKRTLSKQGGMKQTFDKPTAKRRKI
ncbi:hypothetical protein HKX48_002453 [Thoreauomyces humboldtii]|nr:hypothetical protein HKX48_002453 [Thoreauomyces humboldtii]